MTDAIFAQLKGLRRKGRRHENYSRYQKSMRTVVINTWKNNDAALLLFGPDCNINIKHCCAALFYSNSLLNKCAASYKTCLPGEFFKTR